jgi:arylsulfatase A-like enzyme
MGDTAPWWTREIRIGASGGREVLRHIVLVALGSWSLSVASLLLGWLVPGAALRDPSFGVGARAELFAGEFLATSGVVAAASVPWAALAALAHGVGGRSWAAGTVAKAFGAATLALLAVSYAASWAIFWGAGTFLDWEVVTFTLVSPGQVLKHLLTFNPLIATAFPLTLLASVVVVRGSATDRFLGPPRWWPLVSVAFAASIVGAAWLTVHGALVTSWRTDALIDRAGLRTTAGAAWRVARNTRAGPATCVVRALLDSGEVSVTGRLTLPGGSSRPDAEIEPRPYVDPARWAASVASRPTTSVIVLLVESLRPDALRQFGGAREVMPALDALAGTSMRFHRTYSQASHSDYADLCPLSSQYPLRQLTHHYYPHVLPYPRALLHDLLKPLGYRTAVVSSQNESWGNMDNYLVTPALEHFFDSRSRAGQSVVDAEDTLFAKWSADLGLAGKLDDRITIDEAIRWISESDRPFFLYVNLQNSHFPYRLPAGFPPRFAPNTVDFPYAFANYPPEKVGVVRNRYDNSLAYVDSQLARLLGFLARSGRLDRTLVVVTGDNGQAFMEHGCSGHAGPLFEEVVRVPLIIHGPGIAPRDMFSLAEHVDVPPTVLGLLGLPPFPGFQGDDLLARGDDQAFLVVQTPKANQVALVEGRYKLIYDVTEERFHLFDLAADSAERNDLAEREPILRRRLAGRLQTWLDAQLEYYATGVGRCPTSRFPPVVVPSASATSGEGVLRAN